LRSVGHFRHLDREITGFFTRDFKPILQLPNSIDKS
jgi:hypothetical protein